MELHNFFKTFETFVPKNVEGRDQKKVDIMISMQNQMLTFLNANPEFGKQADQFLRMLTTYQDNCRDLNHEFKNSVKHLDLSKLKDLEEIIKFFPVDEEETHTGIGIFSDIHIDASDVRMLRALQKVSDQLSIYSDEKVLYEAIKSKIYTKQAFVVKTKNYEVILDYHNLEDWYATPAEKKAIDKLDFDYNSDGKCYYIAKFLGLTEGYDAIEFLKMIKTESPSFGPHLRKAYSKVLTNMKRGKVVETKYLDYKERIAEGLKKLDDRSYGITDIIYFKKPKV